MLYILIKYLTLVFLFTNRSAPKNYHLAMHIFGLFTTASTLEELDDMVQSAAVVFSSPCSAANVEKHLDNIQTWLQRTKTELDDTKSSAIQDDFKVSVYYFWIITLIFTTTKNSQRSKSIVLIGEKI